MLAIARSIRGTPGKWGMSGRRRDPARPSRLAYVDGARALAALYVVLHHCYQWVWVPPGAGEISVANWWVVGWMSYGHFAVSAFIAISGFSLTLPVVRASGQLIGGAWVFFKRRARRIIPTYYAAIGFALVLDWLFIGQPSNTPWDVTLPITPRTVISHLLLVHNLDPGGNFTINGVFWSIAVEWQIYFFFPLLVLLARRLGIISTTVGTVALCLVAFYIIATHGAHLLQHLPPYWANKLGYLPDRISQIVDYLGLFALGMFAATVAYSPQRTWSALRLRVPWLAVIAIEVVAIAVLLWFQGRQLGTWGTLELDILIALLTLSIFIATASSTESSRSRAAQRLPGKVLGFRPLAFVGQYAYSIYLIHAPIIGVLFSYLVYPYFATVLHLSQIAETAILVAVVFPTVLVVAYLFFLVFERPFLTKRSATRPSHAEVQLQS